MRDTERTKLFDRWAKTYDAVSASADTDFPFGGYEDLLEEVVISADVRPQMRILDLGIGTGNLSARLIGKRCVLWGVDFSAEMLAQARAKLPQANLVQADLMEPWPGELQRPFDRVVSAYTLHEFDLAAKVSLLRRIASDHLSRSGRILVADIAFPTALARRQASERWADRWDTAEHYWAADEAIAACERAGLQVTYKQISVCGGVFTVTTRVAGG